MPRGSERTGGRWLRLRTGRWTRQASKFVLKALLLFGGVLSTAGWRASCTLGGREVHFWRPEDAELRL